MKCYTDRQYLPAASLSARQNVALAPCCALGRKGWLTACYTVCRDPLYEKIKTSLWDIFPQWEDLHYDAAFKEMLWASEGGAPAGLQHA